MNKYAEPNSFKVILILLLILFIIISFFLSSKISSPDELDSLLNFNKLNNHNVHNINDNKDKKIKITVDIVQEIMTGLYSQYRKLNIPLISLEITNNHNYSVSVCLESEIQGLINKTSSIEMIKAGETLILTQYPTLKTETIINKKVINNLHYIIKVDGKTVSKESAEISFYPKDVLFWGYVDNNDKFIDTSLLLAAWVTPTIPQIKQLLKKAIAYHPRKSLYGYQLKSNDVIELSNYAREQVKAIYECIKENYNINYVNVSLAFSPKNIVAQRINLPSETLSRGIANCIDSTVMFASALEAIGFHPYILILKEHSLLGWSISSKSKKLDFIDVTYVSDVSFKKAMEIAYERIKKDNIDFSDKNSEKYSLISIKESRNKMGIAPIE